MALIFFQLFNFKQININTLKHKNRNKKWEHRSFFKIWIYNLSENMSSQRNSAAQAISLVTESVKLLKRLSSFKDQSFNSCNLCVHTGVHVRSTCVHQQMQLYYEKLQKNYYFFQIFSEMWFVFRLQILLGCGLSTTHQRLLQNERVTQIREVLLMLVRTGI